MHEGQVEDHSDQVTLNMIVRIIFVTVSDTMGSIFVVLLNWLILEHQLVFGVLKNVVGVDALNVFRGFSSIFRCLRFLNFASCHKSFE